MSEEWLEVQVPAEDVLMPPTRYAVPASTMPPLIVGELVTVGEPGGWWVIDALRVAHGPVGAGETECYELVPLAERGASQLRPSEQEGLEWPDVRQRARRVLTSDLWIYRDDATERTVNDLVPWRAEAWLDRLVGDLLTPPPVRAPRPARELPSLTGHLVRTLGREGWVWGVAVSEPVMEDDGILVRVVPPQTYWEAVYGVSQEASVSRIALHRLWVY